MRVLQKYTEKRVTSHDGLSIYYEVGGSGPKTLVFVHGLGGDVAAWDEERVYMQNLGYRTIAVDLRAHGYSEQPKQRKGYEVTEFAKDVHEVIQHEKLDDYVLVGHCFGGMVVYTYTLMYPNEPKAIILINSSFRAPYMSQRSPLKLLLHPIVKGLIKVSPRFHIPRHVDYSKKGFEHDFEPFGLVGVIRHNSLNTFMSATDVVFSLDVLEKLKDIAVPTFIISGTKDTIYPQKMSEEMRKRIPNSEFHSVEGANHPVVLNNPIEVSVAMQRFLKKHT